MPAANSDWFVETVVDAPALQTRLNELRDAQTDVKFIIYNGAGYTIVYLKKP